MRFAVTGGAGFVGSSIVGLLLDRGHDVTVVDNLCAGSADNVPRGGGDGRLVFHRVDVRDRDGLRRSLDGADGVFHQAALTDVGESFGREREYRDVNVGGTQAVFGVAGEMGLKVVYASSSSVYGDAGPGPIGEEHARAPASPYGRTKLDCEMAAERHCLAGSRIVGLRYFNVYGAGRTGPPGRRGVVARFLECLRRSEPPAIFGDGRQVRDFVHVEDVALANLAAMDSDAGSGFYNVGTGVATSVLGLAGEMIRLSGSCLEPVFVEPPAGDVRESLADTGLAGTLLGWRHRIGLAEGLRGMMLQGGGAAAAGSDPGMPSRPPRPPAAARGPRGPAPSSDPPPAPGAPGLGGRPRARDPCRPGPKNLQNL